ncbi:hypothetical protein EJ03DRAFT_129832 [Teratosphaeria nubilosa]|uniref:RING-type domain-containing protein n=1 Tax=Teratosphaeria nubilosa TaxID=161662 RepID=A0A6G1LMH3_9PEZI|nr:hypothetical protein EJ03DRAFT_129832 [Teratosphaeria nubilosa]
MEQLMMGYSDRAVLHIDAALRYQGRPPCEPAQWKRPRIPQYGAVISAVANDISFANLEAEDKTCPLCFCSFDEPKHDAVALHCNEKHLLCRNCLVRCCQIEAEKTRCPFCRSPVLTDEKTLEWLKTGALGKSYDPDPQYNDWENHERSIADLDKQRADSNCALLKINSRLLKDTWNVLLKWEEAEPIQSTPRHLNPACAAGGTVVTKAFETMVDRLHGMKFQTNMVFENLMMALRSAISGPSAGGLSLIPGYEACIRRRVSRTLQFAHLRCCKCTQRRYHYHGLRKYYNDDFFGEGFCRPQ